MARAWLFSIAWASQIRSRQWSRADDTLLPGRGSVSISRLISYRLREQCVVRSNVVEIRGHGGGPRKILVGKGLR